MKKFVFSAVIALSGHIHAFPFDGKLDLYQCPTIDDARSCSRKCEKTKIKISYMVDKKNNKVLRKSYLDNQTQSTLLENCHIFNDKNFKCGNGFRAFNEGKVFIYDEESVSDGRMIMATYTEPKSELNNFTCGK